MKTQTTWMRMLYIAGIAGLVLGAIDPLEGAAVIVAGSFLLAVSTWRTQDRHRRLFLASAILIAIGVIYMFVFSCLGGFGGNSSLFWWWGILILPYPIGWLTNIITLIIRVFQNKRSRLQPD